MTTFFRHVYLDGQRLRVPPDPIDVHTFGGSPGNDDNWSAIRAAMDAVQKQGGGSVWFGPGAYRCNSALLVPDSVALRGAGPGVSIIDFSQKGYFANSTGNIMAIDGSMATAVNLTADALRGATTLAVDSIAGIAPNDYIRIWSDEVVLSGEATPGETVHVHWANGTTIYLEHPLEFDYAVSGHAVRVARINTHTGGISDLTIKGAGVNPAGLPSPPYTGVPSEVLTSAQRGDIGIELHYAQDWLIENVEIVGCEYVGVYNNTCIDTRMRNSVVRFDAIPQLSNYGFADWGANLGTRLENVDFYNGRHSYTTLSTPNHLVDHRIGQVKGTRMRGCNVLGGWVYGIDTHRAGSDIVIEDCIVHSMSGGIELRSNNTTVRGCKIYLPRGPTNVSSQVSQSPGIATYFGNRNITIEDNEIDGGSYGIFIASADGGAGSNVRINRNRIRNTNTSPILVFTPIVGLECSFNRCEDPIVSGSIRMDLRDFTDLNCIGNVVPVNVGSGGVVGIQARAATPGSATRGYFADNLVTKLNAGTITGIALENNVTNTIIGFNHLTSCNTPASPGTGITNSVLSLTAGTYDGTQVLAGGVLTVTSSTRVVSVDTEGATPTDTLDSISGGDIGQRVTIKGTTSARVVTVSSTAGNLKSAQGDFVVSSTVTAITFVKLNDTFWQEEGRVGAVSTPASTTAPGAGLRIPHGAAPTSPVDGDTWTTTGGLFVRINGVTKTVTLT